MLCSGTKPHPTFLWVSPVPEKISNMWWYLCRRSDPHSLRTVMSVLLKQIHHVCSPRGPTWYWAMYSLCLLMRPFKSPGVTILQVYTCLFRCECSRYKSLLYVCLVNPLPHTSQNQLLLLLFSCHKLFYRVIDSMTSYNLTTRTSFYFRGFLSIRIVASSKIREPDVESPFPLLAVLLDLCEGGREWIPSLWPWLKGVGLFLGTISRPASPPTGS